MKKALPGGYAGKAELAWIRGKVRAQKSNKKDKCLLRRKSIGSNVWQGVGDCGQGRDLKWY